MSDLMLFGTLRMPYEMAMNDEVSRFQFYKRALQALDRIESLEHRIAYMERYELPVKDISTNKPIAWLRKSDKAACSLEEKEKLIEEEGTDWGYKIPLYTHIVKELTDEEIWELHQEHIYEVTCGHSMKTVGFIEFARAILRKAQEK